MAKKTNTEETIVNVDELYTQTEQFVDKNRKQLTLGLGAVSALVLAVIGYSTLVVAPKNQAAEEASFMAEHYFAKDSMDLAMLGDGLNAGLEEVLWTTQELLQRLVPPLSSASSTATRAL